MKEEFKAHGWIYRGVVSNGRLTLEVQPPFELKVPTRLYKLFSVSKNSVDSFISSRLYVNHPDQFNDLFDCHHELVRDMTEVEKLMYMELMFEFYGEATVKSWNAGTLHQNIIEVRTQFAARSFGIVCMHNGPTNLLMWAYYGNNMGFMVEYDTSMFPKHFLGPFPINYQDVILPITSKYHTAAVSTLYQFTVKAGAWKHENEWRFLVRSDNFEKMFLEPLDGNPDDIAASRSRLFDYPREAVKSVTLGLKFFRSGEISIRDDGLMKVDLTDSESDDLRIPLLEDCINRGIHMNYVLRNRDLMSIRLQPVSIVKKEQQRFELIEI